MLSEEEQQEVYFFKYCPTCQYRTLKDSDEPCHSCLSEPLNLYSHKPVQYKPLKK